MFPNVPLIKRRAAMLSKARLFFEQRQILEVDCPHITKNPSVDTHIDLMKTEVLSSQIGYLHSSPEICMKKLLSLGYPDIYQISHVFRKDEIGVIHNPEFTLVEWYRKNLPFEKMIEETLAFIQLFLPNLLTKKLSYRELFLEIGIDPMTASTNDLMLFAKKKSIDFSAENSDKDTYLELILTHLIEPTLGKDCLFVVSDYPPSQAALSKISIENNIPVAKRFEIYHQGIELANGYFELTDSIEQRKRFELANKKREELKKEKLPLDESFFSSLKNIHFDLCGVAVGFDRLFMLQEKKSSLAEILLFCWKSS